MRCNESSTVIDDMEGREFAFYGVCNNEFKLDDTVYEALEDEDDGYRSYLDTVIVKQSRGIFSSQPLARVRLETEDDKNIDVCKLIDVSDGHVWLAFGTGDYDDYYPYFIFDYEPKAPGEQA